MNEQIDAVAKAFEEKAGFETDVLRVVSRALKLGAPGLGESARFALARNVAFHVKNALGDTILPPTSDMQKREEWLREKASDMGYYMVSPSDHDSAYDLVNKIRFRNGWDYVENMPAAIKLVTEFLARAALSKTAGETA